jgi:transcriptional regulator with XRE-family HTH domain
MQGEEFKRLRKELKFTQEDLARVLDLSRVQVGLMERGVAKIDIRTALAMMYLAEHPDVAMKGGASWKMS